MALHPQRRRALLRRGRQRGVSSVSNVMESAMVMGWFVVLLLGEMSVSSAADARRYAEDAAAESASKSAASYCQGQSAQIKTASATPQSIPNGKPNGVQAAVAMVQALGLGNQPTFPNYLKPLLNVLVKSRSSAEAVPGDVNPAGKQFEGLRDLGCLEKPLDRPQGSMEFYRQMLWQRNLQGY
jgi:hypothetical protein